MTTMPWWARTVTAAVGCAPQTSQPAAGPVGPDWPGNPYGCGGPCTGPYAPGCGGPCTGPYAPGWGCGCPYAPGCGCPCGG
ncbi:hypothetical protein [Streptomyces sp. NPDC053755]|uniref:hypothetical protein n=1 Tax=Streptomyces sp. NPDC053755 TaxID=3155815 RepID=UPI003437F606